MNRTRSEKARSLALLLLLGLAGLPTPVAGLHTLDALDRAPSVLPPFPEPSDDPPELSTRFPLVNQQITNVFDAQRAAVNLLNASIAEA
ncbi:MAG: hypothetical protein ACT4PT_10990, partial [Methanobacteriota archaeon]